MNTKQKTIEESISLMLLDVYPLQIDWRRIADDLRTLRKIEYTRQAEAIGIPRRSFQTLMRRGTPPRFQIGHALLVLHAKVCGLDLTLSRLKSGRT